MINRCSIYFSGAANSGDKPGDYVRLLSDADAVESLQNGHGGWMEETIEVRSSNLIVSLDSFQKFR